jgi:hypothetical protein
LFDKHDNPCVADLLRLLAFLAPDHIPEELLVQGAPYWPHQLRQAVVDHFNFDRLIEVLLAFSLVKRLTKDRLLSIHRLVQVVQIDRMSFDEQQMWAMYVVQALHALFPRDPQDVTTWPLCQRYLEQAEACSTFIQQYQLHVPEAAEVLDRAGIFLRDNASYQTAEPLLQQALHIRELQGTHHLSVAGSLNNNEQQLGSEHPQTQQIIQELEQLREVQSH